MHAYLGQANYLSSEGPSSQLAKLRPRLQASGELPGGHSRWAWAWLSWLPGAARSHTHSHLHALWPGYPPPGMPSWLWNLALAPGALHCERDRVHQSPRVAGKKALVPEHHPIPAGTVQIQSASP